MSNWHFISYSSVDGKDFALRLHDALERDGIPAWLDKRDLKPDGNWDGQIDDAINLCKTLLFVMTQDSVEDQSVCHQEWTAALSYKKRVILIKLDADAEAPFRLNTRHYINFADFDQGIAQLRDYLRWIDTPAGQLAKLKEEHQDAERRLRRADAEAQQKRVALEIEELDRQMKAIEALIANPEAVKQETQHRIDANIERAKQPENPVSGGRVTTKFINHPPAETKPYFQDRHSETKLIGRWLNNPTVRLVTVVGQGGVGKTAMVVRILDSIQKRGQMPDDGERVDVDGIVYLSAVGWRKISVFNLYHDLLKLLSPQQEQALTDLYKNPQMTTAEKFEQLLSHFMSGKVLVLLDNFEDMLDRETHTILDQELLEALQTIITSPPHAIRLLITTRLAPHHLLETRTDRQERINLGQLDEKFSLLLLKEYDADGIYGLKNADDALLKRAFTLTRGYPRALEALAATLKADSSAQLVDVLAELEERVKTMQVIKQDEHNDVVWAMVGQAFNRLAETERQVMQALAIFQQPVTPGAVDYLLQPFKADIDSAPILKRLVNADFVRSEAGRYYLHPVDRDYALSLIPESGEDYSCKELYRHAANYFRTTRKPRAEWKQFADLEPHIAEYQMRLQAKDYDSAASILQDITYEHLFLWGYAHEIIVYYEVLNEKLLDSSLLLSALNNVGLAYSQLGNHSVAISIFQEGLKLAQSISHQGWQGSFLGNLGIAHRNTGNIQGAITLYDKAIRFAQKTGNKQLEGKILGNLGFALSCIGEWNRAIACYENAISISHQNNERGSLGIQLGNLGSIRSSLGDIDTAENLHLKALGISQEIGDRRSESHDLINLGQICLAKGRIAEAINYFSESVQLADEIMYAQTQNYARWALADAYLINKEMELAWKVIEEASQYDSQTNNPSVYILRGIIALIQGSNSIAQNAFLVAIEKCNRLIEMSDQQFGYWDDKGLALAGLALAIDDKTHLAEAISAYRKARSIFAGAGHVERELRLLDALRVADKDSLISAEVRQAAGGE